MIVDFEHPLTEEQMHQMRLAGKLLIEALELGLEDFGPIDILRNDIRQGVIPEEEFQRRLEEAREYLERNIDELKPR